MVGSIDYRFTFNEIFRISISIILVFLSTLYVTFIGESVPTIFRFIFFIWIFYSMTKPDLFFILIISLLILDFFSLVSFGILPADYLFIALIILIASVVNIKRYINKIFKTYKNYFALFVLLFLYTFILTILNEFKLTYFLKVFLVFNLLIGFLPDTKKGFTMFYYMLLVVSMSLTFQGVFSFRELQSYSVDDDIQRLMWVDPNYLSLIILVGILIAFDSLYKNKILINKIFFLIFLLAQLTVLVLLSSRAAMITLVIAMVYYMKGNLKKYQILIALIVLSLSVYVFFELGFFDAIKERNQLSDNLSTLGNRSIIWIQLINEFISRDIFSMFFGTGSNSSLVVSTILGEVTSPHNNFLELLIDYGIVGLAFFLFIILYIFFNSSNKLSQTMLIVVLITSLTLSPFNYFAPWIIILFSVSTNFISKQSEFLPNSNNNCPTNGKD